MVASTNGQTENQSSYQVFDSVMTPASDEDVTSRIPELSQQCANHAEAASTELPLNVEEALIREANIRTHHDAVLDQEMTEEFTFSFPDPASVLHIHGSARSDQGHVQGTCSLLSSSILGQTITTAAESGPQVEQLTSRAASSVNASTTNTSFPNNSVGQNPRMLSDPFEYELERLGREKENSRKNFEETRAQLMAEFEKEMAEAHSEYDRKFQELDSAYNATAMEEEANKRLVAMSSLLANAMMSKCAERSAAAESRAARSSTAPPLIQQWQAVRSNIQISSTAAPLPSVTTAEALTPNPSGSLSHFPRNNTNQSTTISQQAAAAAATRSNIHISSTSPSLPSVTVAEAPIPHPPGSLSHFPRNNMNQSTLMSQQAAAVRFNTHMSSTAPPLPSVTAAKSPIPSHLDLLSQFLHYNTNQSTPMSQQAAAVVRSNIHMSSTAPPLPSVTAAKSPGPLAHFPHHNRNQSTPMSQQAPAVRPNTHMNSTAPPLPSVTAAKSPIPNAPLSHFPRNNMNQSTPMSQQAAAAAAAVRSNAHMSSTALPRPSVTAADAHTLQSPRCNTPQPRPPPLIPNVTPSSSSAASTPPLHGIKRRPAPHLHRFRSSPAPISAAVSTTDQNRLLQEQQPQQKNSKDGLVCLSDDEA